MSLATLLDAAAQSGNVEAMQAALAAWDPVAHDHALFQKALEEAAGLGHTEVVRVMLAHYEPGHLVRSEAIASAASAGHEETVAFLTENLRTPIGCALMGAARNGHLSIVRFLVANKSNSLASLSMAFLAAAQAGQDAILRFLLPMREVRVDEALVKAASSPTPGSIPFLMSIPHTPHGAFAAFQAALEAGNDEAMALLRPHVSDQEQEWAFARVVESQAPLADRLSAQVSAACLKGLPESSLRHMPRARACLEAAALHATLQAPLPPKATPVSSLHRL